MLQKLTWLHISDIHFCSKTAWKDSPTLDCLLNYLQEISCKPDLIFCTGDIAFGNMKDAPIVDQYQQAQQFFDKLLSVCGVTDKKRLFVVPGNHDVNRGSINEAAQEAWINWAANATDNQSKINQRFEGLDKTAKDTLSRLDEYSNFVKQYLGHQHDKNGRHCYTSIVPLEGCKIGIAGFNSAWTCSGEEDDRTIWLPAKWQFDQAREGLKGADIRIGLIHHPIDWLNSVDQNFAMDRIPVDFDFWLHGHIHSSKIDPRQNGHIEVSAGAIGAESIVEFGFNVVQLDLTGVDNSVVIKWHTYDGHEWNEKNTPKRYKNLSLSEHVQKHISKSRPRIPTTDPVPSPSPTVEAPPSDESDPLFHFINLKLSELFASEAGKRLESALKTLPVTTENAATYLCHLPTIDALSRLNGASNVCMESKLHSKESKCTIADIATEILGWLVLLSIDKTWRQKMLAQMADGVLRLELPLRTEAGMVIALFSIQQQKVKFSFDQTNRRVDALGENHGVNIDQLLETGPDEPDQLYEIKKLIWEKVYESFSGLAVPAQFTADNNEALNRTIASRREDRTHDYFVAFKANKLSRALLGQLFHDLSALHALIFEGDGEAMLSLSEAELEEKIKNFFTITGAIK